MRINSVTITGADDATDPQDLYKLSDEFPFVEWGILYYREKFGHPRYPSHEWINKFLKYAPTFVRRSLHICGKSSDDFCGGYLALARYAAFSSDSTFDRIQVNIRENRSPRETSDYLIRSNSVVQTVIQVNDLTLPIVKHLIENTEDGSYLEFLIDQSRGTGRRINFSSIENYRFIMKKSRVGFAGGISPDNVTDIIQNIHAINNTDFQRETLGGSIMCPPAAWIDIESGARTDNEFDLSKVRRILEICRANGIG